MKNLIKILKNIKKLLHNYQTIKKLTFQNIYKIFKITNYLGYIKLINEHIWLKKYFELTYFKKNSKIIKKKFRKNLLSITDKKNKFYFSIRTLSKYY